MTHHWPHYQTVAQRRHAAEAWNALVSGTRTCRCGNLADPDGPTDHLDDPLCRDCAQDESNRENRWSE
jgi:hypothetical protein